MVTLSLQLRDSEPAAFIPPPPGVTSNFVDPPNRGYVVLIPAFVFAALSFVFLVLRVYTVRIITRKQGVADYLMIPSWLFAMAFSVTIVFMVQAGMGRHLWDVPFSTFNINFMKVTAVGGTFYGLSIMLTKLSILAFYLRFVATSPKLKFSIYTTMAIVVIYSIVASWSWLYICQPIAKYWDFTRAGTCIDFNKIAIFSGVMNSATDVMILAFPIPILRNLRLPILQKIGATAIMMAGGFVLAISIMRTVSAVNGSDMDDLSWDAVSEEVWWLVEVHFAIVCACLTTLKPLARKYFPSAFKSKEDAHDERSVSWRRRTVGSIPRFLRSTPRQADEMSLATTLRMQSFNESEALESVVADDEGKNGCLAKGEPQTGGLKTI